MEARIEQGTGTGGGALRGQRRSNRTDSKRIDHGREKIARTFQKKTQQTGKKIQTWKRFHPTKHSAG